jgi:hypothetical protein
MGTGHFVVAGGQLPRTGGQQPLILSDAYIYDVAADRWSTIALPVDMSATWARAHPLADGRILFRHRDLQWAYLLDPKRRRWTEVAVGPAGGRGLSIIAWTGSRLIVWAGRTVLDPGGGCENVHDRPCDPVGPTTEARGDGVMRVF